MMTVLSLSVRGSHWRRGFLAFTAVFAVGTLLARTHYAADALGGAVVAYAITAWGRRHLIPSTPLTAPDAPFGGRAVLEASP